MGGSTIHGTVSNAAVNGLPLVCVEGLKKRAVMWASTL